MGSRLPDVLVIGDSHSTALRAGCDANGLRADMLVISGNFWHASVMMHHPEHGLWAKSGAQRQMILDLSERLGGGSILRPDLPVIASVGFHLGRLVPPFGFNGHTTSGAALHDDAEALFASQAVLDAYVAHHRGFLVRLLQKVASRAPLVVVAPPDVVEDANFRAARLAVVRLIRKAGLHVFDPCETEHFRDLQPLPPDYRAADNVHGNDRYGTELIAAMLAEEAAPVFERSA